jgi:ribosomal-protein-alanine N-acetyltransferase
LTSDRLPYCALETERLLLRCPVPDDGPKIFEAFASDPQVTRFLSWRPHTRLADAEEAVSLRIERLAAGVEYSWVIEPNLGRHVIGIISVWPSGDSVELGFVLARSHWSRGLTTEAVRAVMEWSLASAGVTHVWATCDLENHASARVLEKAGLISRGRFEREIVRPNLSSEPRPSLLFTLPD